MLRRVHRYQDRQHEQMANEVLLAYQRKTGWTRAFPVPVEKIIESVYGLQISVVEIDEGPGEQILGRLVIEERTIELNERHLELGGILEQRGPLYFTYAHELGHWLYDAGNPDQLSLNFDEIPPPVLCRNLDGVRSDRPSDAEQREINANRFAARLLLPLDLLEGTLRERDELAARQRAPLWRCAREWGVSKTTLRIRMSELEWDTEDL